MAAAVHTSMVGGVCMFLENIQKWWQANPASISIATTDAASVILYPVFLPDSSSAARVVIIPPIQ